MCTNINSSVMGPGFHLVTKIKFNKKTSPEGKVDPVNARLGGNKNAAV